MTKVLSLVASVLLASSIANADQLENIQKNGVIKVGVSHNQDPFCFASRSGEVVGFNVEMMQFIAAQMGLKAEFVSLTKENEIDSLQQSKVDVLASALVHKTETDKVIDFSVTYFYDGQALMTRKNFNATSVKDFAGKKVGVIKGTMAGKIFETVQPLGQVVGFNTVDEALEALESKKIDAFSGDFSLLSLKAKKSAGSFKTVGAPFTILPYGFGVKENESNLLDALNTAIQNSVKTGEYDKIYKKWFAKNPTQKPVLWP